MTTLVETNASRPKGKWERFWRKFGEKPVWISHETVVGAPVCHVWMRTEHGVPWEALARVLRPGSTVVMQKHLAVPAEFPVRPIDGEPLRRRLLLNGALWALETAAQSGDVGDVALLDRHARYAALVPRLMPSCHTLTVVTEDRKTYDGLAQHLYGMLGAAPMITDRVDALPRCRAVLAPDGVSGFGAIQRPPLLFSCNALEGLTLTPEDITTPFSDALSARFDVFALLTALRGERAFRDVGRLVPRTMTEGAHIVELREISRRFGT